MAMLLDMCCGSGTRRRAKSSCPPQAADKGGGDRAASTSLTQAVEANLEHVEKSLVAMEKSFEPGESSSRVREQARQEMASEHPEVEGRLLEDALKASGLDKSSDTQKQAELNLNRTGRYKKKHFV